MNSSFRADYSENLVSCLHEEIEFISELFYLKFSCFVGTNINLGAEPILLKAYIYYSVDFYKKEVRGFFLNIMFLLFGNFT